MSAEYSSGARAGWRVGGPSMRTPQPYPYAAMDGLGLDPSAVPSWHPVTDVWVRSPGGRDVRFPLPQGPGRFAVVAR